jgi:hypothetical protein
MSTERAPLQKLVAAAKALLEAREDQMITRVEWEALASAVEAAEVSEPHSDAVAHRPATNGGAPAPHAQPRVGYDNVAFELDGHRVVATVIGYDDDRLMVVGNPNWDDIWHVAVEDAVITAEELNHPPADW